MNNRKTKIAFLIKLHLRISLNLLFFFSNWSVVSIELFRLVRFKKFLEFCKPETVPSK